MREALQADYRITIGAFHAFVDERPDFEKWELIDGEMILNAAPTDRHQIIVKNVLYRLEAIREKIGAAWEVYPGIGTRHPDDLHNEPIPEVMVVPAPTAVSNWTFDVLAAFEVLSPDSLRRDMVRKREFYQRIPSLTHYVVLAQDRREATVFARPDFSPKAVEAGAVEIPPLGVSLPLSDLYRGVLLG
jgi:Uma2 family endonuclease